MCDSLQVPISRGIVINRVGISISILGLGGLKKYAGEPIERLSRGRKNYNSSTLK